MSTNRERIATAGISSTPFRPDFNSNFHSLLLDMNMNQQVEESSCFLPHIETDVFSTQNERSNPHKMSVHPQSHTHSRCDGFTKCTERIEIIPYRLCIHARRTFRFTVGSMRHVVRIPQTSLHFLKPSL